MNFQIIAVKFKHLKYSLYMNKCFENMKLYKFGRFFSLQILGLFQGVQVFNKIDRQT